MEKEIDFRKFFLSKYYSKEWMNRSIEQYSNAQPFPHIVIDDFLPEELCNSVLKSFGSYDYHKWLRFYNEASKKLVSVKEFLLPQTIRNVLNELNSGYVLNWLSHLTGIPRLISDSHLNGGGMHLIEPGGFLEVHTDFNIIPNYGLERQLNLLLYLNKNWKDEYNGHLELWDDHSCVKKVAPIFNRCVIFKTDEKSWHGHPLPLNTPLGITRKSLALYYYNVSDEAVEIAAKKFRPTLLRPSQLDI